LVKEVNNTLVININQVKFERDETKKRTGRIEQQVEEMFKTIYDNAQGENISIEEKIEKIAQAMETYRSHITELTELLPPSTPPEVRT
jgi:predicted  nucleic acid-binding Zn-ribbon protein